MRKRWARQTKGRQMVKMRRIYNSFYSGRSQLQPRLLPSNPLHAATCHQKCLFVIHYFNILLYSRSWYVFFFFFYLTFDCEHSTHGLLRTFYMFSLCFSNLSLYITSPAPLPMQTACWANRWLCTALLRASRHETRHILAGRQSRGLSSSIASEPFSWNTWNEGL